MLSDAYPVYKAPPIDFAKLLFTYCSCLTLTASVAFTPPATPMIRRGVPSLAMASMPFVVSLSFWWVNASYCPSATGVLSTVPEPMASELFTLADTIEL